MKRLFAVLTVVLLATLVSQAQVSFSPKQLDTSGVITLAGSSASNTTQVVIAGKQNAIALSLTFQANAATTDNITFAFQPTVNGTDYGAVYTVPLAMTGTTSRTVITNLPALYGIEQWKLSYVTNAAATAGVTNLSVWYGLRNGL